VANATNHGRPIVLARPDHPVSKALVRLANELRTAGPEGAARSAQPRQPEQPAKRRVFGRRRK
jgi:pilus assembly protein CpaE